MGLSIDKKNPQFCLWSYIEMMMNQNVGPCYVVLIYEVLGA